MSRLANAGGLPRGPRSGPRLASRQDSSPRNDDYNYTPSSSSRVRSQRSIASLPRERERSRSRPPPESRSLTRRGPQTRDDSRSYDTRSEAGDSYHRKSDDSFVSSASSLFERVKGAASGYASSLTSFEGYDEPASKPPPSSMRGQSLRTRRLAQSEPPSPQEYEYTDGSPVSPPAQGDGYTWWNRVATAANDLTINVSKAWASNITTYAGEETPPGQESRLTRAMKAYHLEKARSPTDLPAWLFNEHERRPKISRRTEADDYEVIEKPVPESAPRPRGLKDIYAAAAAQGPAYSARSEPPSSKWSSSSSAPSDQRQPASKASDRLRAIREAKRGGAGGGNGSAPMEDPPMVPQQSKRVGLPSGPMQRRR